MDFVEIAECYGVHSRRSFLSCFGITPRACQLVFSHLNTKEEHLLRALAFLTTYAPYDAKAPLFDICEKTYRTYLWDTVTDIANLDFVIDPL
jgi:hypothetical protein